MAPAQFGYQKYGGTLKGWLVLPMNETYHKECPKCPRTGGMCTDQGPEPLGIISFFTHNRIHRKISIHI